ncbi:60S ribosomal protein L18a-like protein [Quillaja saponaria]|uniref:60S ribosomal protein L18a-like protein n=1 Tax=Quillaja saponaria TaxID=32244 RepID=A0AAD7PI31_QUISA|nr:60S ribosomal protein L18a-like protein [Quillaja saponaria]
MDQNAKTEETDGLRTSVELARSVSDKHLDLLRPSARHYSIFKGGVLQFPLHLRCLLERPSDSLYRQALDADDRDKGKYILIRDPEDFQQGTYDKPLPCFGCGIGWFSFLLGFLCPAMWYYATILYIGNHYRKDPRERAGLAASAIAALACSVALLVMVAILLFKLW